MCMFASVCPFAMVQLIIGDVASPQPVPEIPIKQSIKASFLLPSLFRNILTTLAECTPWAYSTKVKCQCLVPLLRNHSSASVNMRSHLRPGMGLCFCVSFIPFPQMDNWKRKAGQLGIDMVCRMLDVFIFFRTDTQHDCVEINIERLQAWSLLNHIWFTSIRPLA